MALFSATFFVPEVDAERKIDIHQWTLGGAALPLARVCSGEAGPRPSDDCKAIWAVIKDRAARMGVSRMTALRWYSSFHFDRTRTDARAYVPWLRYDGRRPKHWPSHLRWSVYRPDWLDLLAQARRIVQGKEVAKCDGEANHWGSGRGIDLRRAQIAGWHPIDCGDTLNVFYRAPELPPLD